MPEPHAGFPPRVLLRAANRSCTNATPTRVIAQAMPTDGGLRPHRARSHVPSIRFVAETYADPTRPTLVREVARRDKQRSWVFHGVRTRGETIAPQVTIRASRPHRDARRFPTR